MKKENILKKLIKEEIIEEQNITYKKYKCWNEIPHIILEDGTLFALAHEKIINASSVIITQFKYSDVADAINCGYKSMNDYFEHFDNLTA